MIDARVSHIFPTDLRLSRKEAAFAFSWLAAVPLPVLHGRLMLLRLFNRRLARVLDLIDLLAVDTRALDKALARVSASLSRNPSGSSSPFAAFDPSAETAGAEFLSLQLRKVSHVVFGELKHRVLVAAITATAAGPVRVAALTLDNMRAALSTEAGVRDALSSECVFMQAFRQLSKLPPQNLQALMRSQLDGNGRLWMCKYADEAAMDAGGVFNDCVSTMVSDLFSSHLDLMLPCPNATTLATDAVNRDKMLPNPRYATRTGSQSSRSIMALYEFIGRFMGMSLRTRLGLPFDFAP
jgi:hypothetical protein